MEGKAQILWSNVHPAQVPGVSTNEVTFDGQAVAAPPGRHCQPCPALRKLSLYVHSP